MIAQMEGVRIGVLEPVNQTPRGKNTWEIKAQVESFQQVSVYRRADEIFGAHYHEGTDPAKNPEYLYLLIGKVEAVFVSKDGTRRMEMEISAPAEIIIDPFVVHTFRTVGEVLMIETRKTRFNPEYPDTVPADLLPWG